MASLKAIRKRISSVKNTQQITKAMKMVSAAKLRRAQEAATQARAYADKLEALLRSVAARAEAGAHPLLNAPEEERRRHLLLVASDRGLCGGFNANLIRNGETFLKEVGGEDVKLTIVGRRAYDYFKRRPVDIVDKHVNLFGGPDYALAESLARSLAQEFIAGKTDGVYLIYSSFKSALSQIPTRVRLLPIEPATAEPSGGAALEYLYEPDEPTVLGRLLNQYLAVQIQRAFLESTASEHAARMTAMESATSNASDMISRLTLVMNRARQAAITTELMEIVSGAEALKG